MSARLGVAVALRYQRIHFTIFLTGSGTCFYIWVRNFWNSLTGKIAHMSQAIMEPEEVRRFAKDLKNFNTGLEQGMSLLEARFKALGDTWQDQEHRKFAEEFSQTMRALRKFVEVSNHHTPFLLRKAQRIEDYLEQR